MIKENTIKEGLQKGIGIFKNIISKEIKMVPLSKLQINDEYQAVFTQEGEKIKRIAEDIKVNGFDKTQPIVVLPDFTIVDGHTRYFAAQEIALKTVPVMIKRFESKDDTLLYMYNLQLNRRNLSEQEIFKSFIQIEAIKNKTKEEGKQVKEFTDQKVAEQLKVSPRQLSKMREVYKKSPKEIVEKIETGQMTINQAHSELKNEKPSLSKKQDKIAEAFLNGVKFALFEAHQGKGIQKILAKAEEFREGDLSLKEGLLEFDKNLSSEEFWFRVAYE